MPSENMPLSPLEAYKEIIDDLVGRSASMSARLVRKEAIFSKAPAKDKLNQFVQSLTSEQRIVLADILSQERFGAIHDVLATITWWIDCRDVGFTYRGEAMPVQLSGMGLHGDYVARHDDWEWPKDSTGT